MNEHLALKEERGRPYGVLVCFVPRSLKDRYVRGAKMRRGRTISAFIREAMDLLIKVEERLLTRIEVITCEYAEREYLNSQLSPQGKGSEAGGAISLIEEGATQAGNEKRRRALSAIPTRKPSDTNPILAFIEAKQNAEM